MNFEKIKKQYNLLKKKKELNKIIRVILESKSV